MKKILWVSRHQMTEGQLDDLKRIYGEFELVKFDQTVSNVKEIIEAGKNCDVLAVVLPPALLADLVNPRNNEKPVIRAIASRVETGNKILNPATGKKELEYRFVHVAWERVLKIEIITEKLQFRKRTIFD